MSIKAINKRFTLACIFALHGLIVWLHGGEQTWEVALAALFVGLGFIAVIWNDSGTFKPLKPLSLPLSLFAIWLVYLCMDFIPMPISWVAAINVEAAALQIQASADISMAYLSISPGTSLLEVFEFTTIVMLFVLTVIILKLSKSTIALCYWMIFIGISVAIYSIINQINNGRFELIAAIPPWNSDWESSLRGTFSYKNQFAVYLAMLIPLAFGLFKDQLKTQWVEYKYSSAWKTLLLHITSRTGVLIVSTMILLYVLTQTDSRGAILVFAISSLLIVAKRQLIDKRSIKSSKNVWTYVFVVLVLAITFFNSATFERFKRYGVNDNGRAELHQVAKQVINDFAIVGSGAGTYALIQHKYKPEKLGNNAMSKRAHSDYLELLATQGIIGAALLFCAFYFLLKPIFTGQSKQNPNLLLGCQCSLLILILHSSFDFNLATFYLPALFLTIVAIAYRLISNE